MSIKLGIVGVGEFAQCFIPLFKAHPLVAEVTLCDLDANKLDENCTRYGITKKSPSLEHLLTTDIDAVVIMSQNWLHGPQALQALRAKKHVYSAVPMGVNLEEIKNIVKAVEETGQIYMMGETSYYYPATIYCREKFKAGGFGHIVYGEGDYFHDWEHGLYDVFKWRGGENWLETAGNPPMYYPTHSISKIISVTGAYITHVSCHGFVDKHGDGIYKAGVNKWNNTFSNQTALFTMSDGSSFRVNEFRRIGHPETVRMNLFGTEGCFEQNAVGAMWLTRNEKQPIDDLLTCLEWHSDLDDTALRMGNHYAKVHPTDRLPKEFNGLRNAHFSSHHFLVDDFVRACAYGATPPIDAWQAARYTIPGIIAHESAINGGVLLAVPDLGDSKTKS